MSWFGWISFHVLLAVGIWTAFGLAVGWVLDPTWDPEDDEGQP